MSMELQNAIRFGIGCGWIRTISQSIQISELVNSPGKPAPNPAQSKSSGRGRVTVTNSSFINCGTAVQMGGGHLTMTGSHIESCGTAFSASGDARIDASHMSIDKCGTVFKELR